MVLRQDNKASKSGFKTQQEHFWADTFGDEYITRNNSLELIANNTVLFSRVFKRMDKITSVIEFGANIGNNLLAIRNICPEAELSAIEINTKAVEILKTRANITVYPSSILNFTSQNLYDFVFIKGVLIHINPDELLNIYEKLYTASKRYIFIAEYYNPTPVTVPYRGHEDRLFKRDFAGEMLDIYGDLKLMDYGFCYHKDRSYSQDDITWFLMEKMY